MFWAKGFDAASLPDLKHAPGLSHPSTCHAFDFRRGLLDASVESYLDEIVRPRLHPLTGTDVATVALVDYLNGLRDTLPASGAPPAANGCLLVNAACSSMARDGSVARAVASHHAELRAALTAGVQTRLPHLSAEEQTVLGNTCAVLVVSAFTLVGVDTADAGGQLDVVLTLIADRTI